ncbi:MAG: hypothetical protein HRT35_32530 [Algicola sp.]|nr:hypothetical protein [Algicola sp.]
MKINEVSSDRRVMLCTLWIFYMCNILYGDVLMLIEGMAAAPSTELATEAVAMLLTPEMLLAAAVLLETAMMMIFLSRTLKYKANRLANIIVGILHTAMVTASLFVDTPSLYTMFLAMIEIPTSLFIVWYAWTWPNPATSSAKSESAITGLTLEIGAAEKS